MANQNIGMSNHALERTFSWEAECPPSQFTAWWSDKCFDTAFGYYLPFFGQKRDDS